MMDIKQLRVLLESMGIFLAHDELAHLYGEVKADGEKVSLRSLIDFAETKREVLHTQKKQVEVLKRCIKNFGFWTSLCFVFGTIPYVSVDYAQTEPSSSLLTRMSCVFYLIAAYGGLYNVYNSESSALSAVEEVHMALRSTAVKVGMLLSLYDRALIRASTVRGVTENNVALLTEEEIQSFQRRGAHELLDFASVEISVNACELQEAFTTLGKPNEKEKQNEIHMAQHPLTNKFSWTTFFFVMIVFLFCLKKNRDTYFCRTVCQIMEKTWSS